MLRIGIVLAAVALFLSGCSFDDVTQPVDITAATTARSADSASRTTAAPPSDKVMATDSASPTTSDAPSPTSSPERATAEPPAETSAVAAPPVVPEPDPCAADTLSNDLLGYLGGVEAFVCEQGWVYAYYVGGTGDAEFVAQRQNGQWVQVAGLGSPTCQEELMELGAPRSVVTDFLPCELMYPPDEPTEPVEDCVVPTEQYGATYATLYNIGCDEAAEQFYSAADNYPPSFEEPIITPHGWECWVYPHDPSYAVAGSCTAPDGSANFVLNIPSYR